MDLWTLCLYAACSSIYGALRWLIWDDDEERLRVRFATSLEVLTLALLLWLLGVAQ